MYIDFPGIATVTTTDMSLVTKEFIVVEKLKNNIIMDYGVSFFLSDTVYYFVFIEQLSSILRDNFNLIFGVIHSQLSALLQIEYLLVCLR